MISCHVSLGGENKLRPKRAHLRNHAKLNKETDRILEFGNIRSDSDGNHLKKNAESRSSARFTSWKTMV